MYIKVKKSIIIFFIFTFFISVTFSQAQIKPKPHVEVSVEKINYEKVINLGFRWLCEETHVRKSAYTFYSSALPTALEQWYNYRPEIEFASLIDTTLTIKFTDGSYIIIIDIYSTLKELSGEYEQKNSKIEKIFPTSTNGQTALILNPSEYLYGNRHCKKIINKLISEGYNVVYLSNEDVDLPYIKDNLNAKIVYMNTHAGYWDIDGDHHGDAVVIGTGEYWTNETTQIYQFEYENQMIVEGMVGDKSFVAFTPAFIEYYYETGEMPNSLIYMATCHAAYDDTMANAFLDAGADAYMGWTRNTVFWTNSITSVLAFRLFTKGFTVHQVCSLIRSGSLYNFIFKSKLTYYGDGTHRILKS